MKKIVFVHGLNCTPRIFNYVKATLPPHDPIFISYDSNSQLDEILAKAAKELPDTEYDIVGHSLGGVIAVLLAAKTRKNKPKKIVTISSPLGGARAANYLKWLFPSFKLLNDVCTTSPHIQAVKNANIKQPILSIISVAGNIPLISEENDGVVAIESQRALKNAKHVEIDANHFEVMQHEETTENIQKFLWK